MARRRPPCRHRGRLPTLAHPCVNRTTEFVRAFAGRCPPRRTIFAPCHALIPGRASSRAKRCPHISTRQCVSAERDALWLAPGRLTTGRGRRPRARDRSDAPRDARTGARGRFEVERCQLFVRCDALARARDRRVGLPRALAPGRGASRASRGQVAGARERLSVARGRRYIDRGPLTLNGGHSLRSGDSSARPSIFSFLPTAKASLSS